MGDLFSGDNFGASLFQAFIEIGLITLVIYLVLLFVRGTRAAPILAGALILFAFFGIVSYVLNLTVIAWMVKQVLALVALLVLIVFQPEIRRAFAELGRGNILKRKNYLKQDLIETIADVVDALSKKRIGALIAIEREIGMRLFAESGTLIEAHISHELLEQIFYPNTPLHDGGVIISKGQLRAAGCFFPLTQNDTLQKTLGTRHRAGVGVTEETDCLCIIVSEETGAVSMSYKGRLVRGLERERLTRHMNSILIKRKEGKKSVAENVEHLKQSMLDNANTNELEEEDEI